MALCFLCHELAMNMDIQHRLHEEIVEVDDELQGKSVTFEALQKMKYLDMVVSEGLRKWPLAVIMDRNTNQQYVMEDHDGTKALLQPNDTVWFPIYGMSAVEQCSVLLKNRFILRSTLSTLNSSYSS